LLLIFLVVLNIVVFTALPLTFNWSEKGGLYSLSPESIDILEKLNKPTKIYVLMAPNSRQANEVRYLLTNCQALTGQLEVEYISPDRDFDRYEEIVRKYPEVMKDQFNTSGRGLLMVFGPEPETKTQKPPPHKFIADGKLTESADPMGRGRGRFVGGKGVMSEIKFFMVEQKQAKSDFLHGER